MDFTSGDSPYGTPEAEDVLLIHVSENLASPSQRMTQICMITETKKVCPQDRRAIARLPTATILVQSGLHQPSARCYGSYG